jgi:hypothetical protein
LRRGSWWVCRGKKMKLIGRRAVGRVGGREEGLGVVLVLVLVGSRASWCKCQCARLVLGQGVVL